MSAAVDAPAGPFYADGATVAGEYAPESVRRTARSARSGVLRGRAEAVERVFQAGDIGGTGGAGG